MRIMLLVAVSLTLAACGEQAAPAPAAAASMEARPGVGIAATSTEITDAQVLTLEQIRARLVGVHRSMDDALASLTISSDGRWTSNYQGNEPVQSHWILFRGDQPPSGAEGPFLPGSSYLEVKDTDVVLYYELGHVAEDGFDMFYTARGNNLRFVRMR